MPGLLNPNYGRRYAIKMLLGIEPDMDTNTEQDTELGDVKEPLPKKQVSAEHQPDQIHKVKKQK